jgi:acyl-CoA thioester hydrolase
MSDRSVLIIDDDQNLVSALKEGLETLGYRVATAYDGLQGVLQAHQGKPDIIMLDFNMPAGGGGGVYDRLRSSTDTAKTPIVFLTGATVEEVKKTIRSTPNTFFLKKPISVAQLRKVLDKIIAGRGGNGASAAPAPAEAPPQAAPPPAPSPGGPPSDVGGPKTSPFSGMGTPAETSVPTAPAETPGFDQPLGRPHDEAAAPPPSMSAVPPPTLGAPTPLPNPAAEAPPANTDLAPGVPPVAEAPPAPAPAAAAPAPSVEPPAPGPATAAETPGAAGALRDKVYEFEFRVPYPDADRLGIVHYSNYLRYFETGRIELLRAIGVRYRDMEIERQLFLPALDSRCGYHAPCRCDDLIRVRAWLTGVEPGRLSFAYEVLNLDEGGARAVEGATTHQVLDAYWKSSELPEELLERIRPYSA